MKTPKQKRDKLALSEHKDRETFQNWLRTTYSDDVLKYRSGAKSKYSIDNVCVAGILYTMDEYDTDGKTVTLSNKRNIDGAYGQITIDTSDRYSPTCYRDAIVGFTPAFGLRDGINYLD